MVHFIEKMGSFSLLAPKHPSITTSTPKTRNAQNHSNFGLASSQGTTSNAATLNAQNRQTGTLHSKKSSDYDSETDTDVQKGNKNNKI